jgi:hypothetical protein
VDLSLTPETAKALTSLVTVIQKDSPGKFWDLMSPWYLGQWPDDAPRAIAAGLVEATSRTWPAGSHVTLRDIERFVHHVTGTVHESIPVNEFVAVDILWWLLTRSEQSLENLRSAPAEIKWTVQLVLLAKLIQLQ